MKAAADAILLAISIVFHVGSGLGLNALNKAGRGDADGHADWTDSVRDAEFQRKCMMRRGPGAICTLDEAGFKESVDTGSEDQLEIFVRRLIDSGGGKIAPEHKTLSGFLPFYSGQKASQPFDHLVTELQKAPWIAHFKFGHAPKSMVSNFPEVELNQTGYEYIFYHGGPKDMELFIRRLILSSCAEIMDEDSVAKLASRHIGSRATSFNLLIKDIEVAPWVSGYTHLPLSVMDINEEGFRRFWASKDQNELRRYVTFLLKLRGGRVSDQGAFQNFLSEFIRKEGGQSFASLSKALGEEDMKFVKWSVGAPWPLQLKIPHASLALLEVGEDAQELEKEEEEEAQHKEESEEERQGQ